MWIAFFEKFLSSVGGTIYRWRSVCECRNIKCAAYSRRLEKRRPKKRLCANNKYSLPAKKRICFQCFERLCNESQISEEEDDDGNIAIGGGNDGRIDDSLSVLLHDFGSSNVQRLSHENPSLIMWKYSACLVLVYTRNYLHRREFNMFGSFRFNSTFVECLRGNSCDVWIEFSSSIAWIIVYIGLFKRQPVALLRKQQPLDAFSIR